MWKYYMFIIDSAREGNMLEKCSTERNIKMWGSGYATLTEDLFEGFFERLRFLYILFRRTIFFATSKYKKYWDCLIYILPI